MTLALVARSSFASSSRVTLHHLSLRYTSSLAQIPHAQPPVYSGRVPSGRGPDPKEPAKELAKDAPTDMHSPAPAVFGNRRKVGLKSKKAAITMTPAAVDHLRALVASPTEPRLLRISVKSRGCAGMAYHLDYVPPPGGRFDEVVEQDGVKVLIDSKALFSIIGSRMDWRDNRLSAGFVFDNPNVVDTCGCGESFNIKF